MTGREFDVVVFGATGFTGSLVAEHLAAAADPGVRIALAGRSRTRLEAVRDRLCERARDWELLEVEATDALGLERLAARTTVLATTVGPFATYGKEVVRAAARSGTHYVDLTGEVLFVRWSMAEAADLARQSGARIVHSCGFDSVPSDLGVLVTAERAAAEGQGTLEDTLLVVRSLRGGVSGGTIDTFRRQVIATRHDPALRAVLRDPYALSPRRPEEPTPPPHRHRGPAGRVRRLLSPRREPATGHWLGPFAMAGYNTRLVRLSNTLTDWSYGRGLRYREASDYGSGPAAPVLATGTGLALGALYAGMSWAPTRAVLDRLLPAPGEGPGPERRAAGHFRMEITSTTTTGARYRTTVAARLDPGYGATAVLLGQSALCLALDGPLLPPRSGVLTPATAMGDPLVQRLRARGFTIETERIG